MVGPEVMRGVEALSQGACSYFLLGACFALLLHHTHPLRDKTNIDICNELITMIVRRENVSFNYQQPLRHDSVIKLAIIIPICLPRKLFIF